LFHTAVAVQPPSDDEDDDDDLEFIPEEHLPWKKVREIVICNPL
jgi:hypothetical protein